LPCRITWYIISVAIVNRWISVIIIIIIMIIPICCTYVCLGVLEIYQCVSSAAVISAMGRKPRNSLKNAWQRSACWEILRSNWYFHTTPSVKSLHQIFSWTPGGKLYFFGGGGFQKCVPKNMFWNMPVIC